MNIFLTGDNLNKWNLVNSDLIPEGSTILYENISFVDRYKWIGGLFSCL